MNVRGDLGLLLINIGIAVILLAYVIHGIFASVHDERFWILNTVMIAIVAGLFYFSVGMIQDLTNVRRSYTGPFPQTRGFIRPPPGGRGS